MRLKELMLINLMNHVNSICNDDYFLKVNFRFQPRARDAHHDLMEKAISFNDIVSVRGNDYRIHVWHINEDEAINRTNNANLKEQYRFF